MSAIEHSRVIETDAYQPLKRFEVYSESKFTATHQNLVMKYIGSLDDNFGRSLLFGNVTGIIMVGFIGWSAWAMIQDLLSML